MQTIAKSIVCTAMNKTLKTNERNRAALPMFALTLPLVFETFFRILVSSVDTFMLSSYSQEAVAGVGLIAQYIFFIHVMFNMICIGTSIVLSQYLGANRDHDATEVSQASALLVSSAAVLLSMLVFGAGKPLLARYSIEESVREYAWQYFSIFGGIGSFFMAFNLLQSTIMRAYGHTRDAMYISLIANLVNVVGNSLSLYGWFGLPALALPGPWHRLVLGPDTPY